MIRLEIIFTNKVIETDTLKKAPEGALILNLFRLSTLVDSL